MNADAYLARLFMLTADILGAAGLAHEERHLRNAKIVKGNMFQCANRAYIATELNVRMNFGRVSSNPNSVAARAVEAMSMLRCAMDHLVCSRTLEIDWLEAIEARMDLLRHQAWNNQRTSPKP